MQPPVHAAPGGSRGATTTRISNLEVRRYRAAGPDGARDESIGPAPLVVLVHGSLDRGDSFRRVVRRLPWADVVTYDRRGYRGSRHAGPPADLLGHVRDLVSLLHQLTDEHHPAILAGHSLGGDVVLGAAMEAPELASAVVVYEPPLPWLGFGRSRAANPAGGEMTSPGSPGDPWGEDPAVAAQRFFEAMVGSGSWARLSVHERQERQMDGTALLRELRSLRAGTPFDVTCLRVPLIAARGGPAGAAHHRAGVAWLADHVTGAELAEVPGASHGAHLSHPDAFAGLIERAADRAGVLPVAPGTSGALG